MPVCDRHENRWRFKSANPEDGFKPTAQCHGSSMEPLRWATQRNRPERLERPLLPGYHSSGTADRILQHPARMNAETLPYLAAAVCVVAFLYSSVGHAGASGYIAVMTLFHMAPEEIKPAALVLNILVASITTWRFHRAGHFSWSLFWPFALLAIPMAFVGGYVNLPTKGFKLLVGIVLWFSAIHFLLHPKDALTVKPPRRAAALPIGAGLGLMSGLTGTGGGIFLTPLLLGMRWARAKQAAAVSALFILVNSSAGLLGNLGATRRFPVFALVLAAAAIAGGTAGSYFGSNRFDPVVIRRLLAVVLMIAGTKLLSGA